MNTALTRSILYFTSKTVMGTTFHGWRLLKPNGTVQNSTFYPSKSAMLSNCVYSLGTPLRDQKQILISSDLDTTKALFDKLDEMFPSQATR